MSGCANYEPAGKIGAFKLSVIEIEQMMEVGIALPGDLSALEAGGTVQPTAQPGRDITKLPGLWQLISIPSVLPTWNIRRCAGFVIMSGGSH